jgi:hypothetical protein
MKVLAVFVFALVIASTGCVCMFVPCDRKVHVSGHVFDEKHKPLRDADVEFYGVTHKTDKNGCFYFGGLLAAPGFNVVISKPGYKKYEEGREFDYYDIDVTLAPEDDSENSSGSWRKLQDADLGKFKLCADE